MDSSDSNVFVLEGSGPQKGGLFVKEKAAVEKEDTFKVPQQVSLFGLDKLAAVRRKEKEESGKRKHDDDGKPPKHYRTSSNETPTHTGGVSYEAQKRARDRYDKHKDRGVFASTKDANQRDRGHSSSQQYSRDERERSRSRHSERSRYSDRRSATPRFEDAPPTPYYKMRNPISRSTWEDEDEPLGDYKRSDWDYPTPRGESRERSERSHRSRRYDETPRPTPAYKFNAWAKDRRKTGATPGTGD